MKQETQITNRYRIISKLGQGGMGAVWRVYDRLEKSEVALKQVLIPDKQLDFASKAGTDDTGKLRLSLAQEFSILATLRHPHILSVLDFGFDDKGHPFYTMDLIEGGTDCKTYGINLARSRRIVLMGQMLQALHYLHRRGVLHRDLKPDNVFVTRDEQVKVMDFGLAKQDKAQSTQSDTISGTIAYMAPELFQGTKASVASDLFAIGVMVYEIMVGQHPYAADHVGQIIMKIMTHTPDFSAIPDNFVPWLQTMLEKDPANRFPTTYDAMVEFYDAVGIEMPAEAPHIRESFLQASEFVGRDSELKQLTDALVTISTQNAFFLVGGESGVGKSRLLDELRIQGLVKGAVVLRGQAVEGGGLPFQLWRNIVRRMLLMVEVTDLQAGILKDIVPDIDALLQRDIANAPELTGKAHQDRIVLTIVDLFRDLPQPVVLLLEDLQWTDESLTVLQQMLRVTEQLPKLMIVANYRDDEAPDLPQKLAGMTHIKLERLDADAVSQLSRAMLGDVGENEEVVQLLRSQSEGNLFFLVETVRALAEASGDLQRIGQGDLPEGVFTDRMQAITRRRLSKVDTQYIEIQTLAAVIGREIDVTLLAYAQDEISVNAWLNNAAEYGVVSIQDNTWHFAHDKLREAIIADIPDKTLPSIHRTAAEKIEAVYPDDVGYNEALLNHWQQVGDLDKMVHYALPVVKNMIDTTGAYTTADTLLQHLLGRLPEDDGRCVALWNCLADSMRRQDKYNQGQGYAEQARQLASRLADKKGLATSLNHLGVIATCQEEYDRATDYHQQCLVLNQQLDDQHGIASSFNNLGVIAWEQGDYARAIDLTQQSLVIKQQLGDQRGMVSSLNNLGGLAWSQGDYARATDFYQQSLALRQQLGMQQGIADSLNNLGVIADHQGDYARATDLMQQSLMIRQQLGNPKDIVISLHNLGNNAVNKGGYTRAIDLYQQSLAISQKLKFQTLIIHNYIGLGSVAFKQKHNEEARRWFVQALRNADNIQATLLALYSVVDLASIIAHDGQNERAARYIALAEHHPAKDSKVRKTLDEVMPMLEAALSPDELQAALERGKSLDLDTVVQELLAEFGGDDL